MENYCWKKNTCMHWWQFIKLSYITTGALGTGLPYTLLIKIWTVELTWKEGYGNDCLRFVFIFFIIIPPLPPKKSLGPATTYSWKVLTLPKLFVKKSLCPVLVCTGPSPQINIARSLKLPIRYPFHEIWVSLRLNLRWILYESSIFFLFNIEGYGEFFSGIPEYNFLKIYTGTRVHFVIFVIFIKIKYFPF